MSDNIFKELTRTTTTQELPLGTSRREGGKSYVYVQNAAAGIALTNGDVCYSTIGYSNIITTDVSDINQEFNMVRGIAIGAMALSSFGWVQTWGEHTAVHTNGDDDIAVGDYVIGDTADGVCDSVAAGTASTYVPIGVCYVDDVDSLNTVGVFIRLERN